jgi:hypothetical protein
MAYLSENKHPYADQMISYPNAGHLFILATHGPESARNSMPTGMFEMLFGGTPLGDAFAATRGPASHATRSQAQVLALGNCVDGIEPVVLPSAANDVTGEEDADRERALSRSGPDTPASAPSDPSKRHVQRRSSRRRHGSS